MRPPGCRFAMLGLLGGMGPEATADVLAKIARLTEARHDQDHIPIIIRSVPQIPDRTDALFDRGASPEPALVEGALFLRAAGADFLAIACNTAHHWYETICKASGLPVVHIAEAVLQDLAEMGEQGPVGLLATAGTIKSGFYQSLLADAGLAVLVPGAGLQSESVDSAIGLVKSGQIALAREAVRPAIDSFHERGAKTVILACTELPLLINGMEAKSIRFMDANLSLARACVVAAEAFGAMGSDIL